MTSYMEASDILYRFYEANGNDAFYAEFFPSVWQNQDCIQMILGMTQPDTPLGRLDGYTLELNYIGDYDKEIVDRDFAEALIKHKEKP